MSPAFLSVTGAGADVVARSPMEGMAAAAGARFEVRDGWNVAVAYPGAGGVVGWADTSHLPTCELQGAGEAISELPFGTAVRRDATWWCRLEPARALLIGDGARDAAADPPAGVTALDVTSVYAALTLVGPQARETIARFCALDLRPAVAPVTALRPGSVARQPGIVIREAEDRYLLLFGWATGEYVWSVVADAAVHLGGGPIGVDALEDLDA